MLVVEGLKVMKISGWGEGAAWERERERERKEMKQKNFLSGLLEKLLNKLKNKGPLNIITCYEVW